MPRDQVAAGCVENCQRSSQDTADSEPLAIRTERGGHDRSTDASVLCQRSHFPRGRVQAEDGKPTATRTVTDDGQRQTIGRQSQAIASADGFRFDGCDHLAAGGVAPPNLVVDDDQPVAVAREDQTANGSIGGIDPRRLLARGGFKYANLAPFGQSSQPSVGRQGADLSAGTAGKVAAACFIFVLRIQVPTPHLAVLIQRHQLTICGESAADDGDAVSRENRGAAFQQMLVVVPLKATQVFLCPPRLWFSAGR